MSGKISCPSCGANDFTKLHDGSLQCSYCDTVFNCSSENDSVIYKDKKITGDMQKGLRYVVHSRLIVSGDMNNIRLSRNLDNATHVNILEITGDMNQFNIELVDGATYDINGDMNHLTCK